ncbi:MAG: hypothetical protein JST89_24440 [Cyanobacteria bacterium SZAS-4]|nr:hypothetical protein [Cyanobacteria bacterium SZAS-4]
MSEDYATSNTNPGGEDGSSLAARRARLRGTLAKQAAPPDPYKPDPYLMAPSPSEPAMPSASSEPVTPNDPAPAAPVLEPPAPETPTFPEPPAPEPVAAEPPAPEPSTPASNLNEPVAAPVATSATEQVPSSMFSDLSAAMFSTDGPAPPSDNEGSLDAETAALASEMAAAAQAAESSYGGNGSGSVAPTLSSASFFAAAAPSVEPSNRSEEKASFFSEPEPEVESVPEPETEKTAPPSGRVDRRRHSAAPATLPPIPDPASIPAAVDPDSIMDLNYMPDQTNSTIAASSPPDPVPPTTVANNDVSMSSSGNYVYGIQAQDATNQQAPTQLQSQAIEIMNNIDQAMGACAMNLSELQKIASEQTDALKGVAETLQNQSFFEMGLNINSLVDTLAAALEPMKAVGELVPAIDQLVAMMESREVGSSSSEESSRPSREQLITSLAEQLSSGMIDPWTFKCAYMAVFPAEHPADLLHRLVDLLGTQRLSGDLFRAAYDAVQAPDPPPRSPAEAGETQTIVKMVQDESVIAQLDELKRTNDEFLRRNEEIQKKLEAKDSEFNVVLTAKEQELQEAQELLNSRWEEFNTRYDELTETLHKRDEVLQEREAELAKKESENNQLRTQMEELRDQTKEMVADLQRQLSAKPKEEAPKQAGFFDAVPNNAQQNQQPAPAQQGQLFDAGPSRPLFGQTDQQQQQNSNPMEQLQPQVQQGQPAPQQQPQPALQQPMAPQPAQAAGNQAVPRPAAPTTPFVSGAGSYGSGVRAQVFEVIVRQALAGAPWREICAGPMQVNNISPEEVETEVKRRQALLKK